MRMRGRNGQAVERPSGSFHQLDSVALDALAAVRVLQSLAQEMAVEDPRVARSALELILAVERFVSDVGSSHYPYEH
jgi:hypothetical protein